jgi:preprotein translocase subunit YajC
MTLLNVMLMAGASDPKSGGSIQLVLMGGIIVVFWFFMIRPQAKKAKEQKKFIDELQKGAKIITNAGIHATIYKVNEDGTLQIEVNPGSYLKIEKSAVSMDMTVAINKPTSVTVSK